MFTEERVYECGCPDGYVCTRVCDISSLREVYGFEVTLYSSVYESQIIVSGVVLSMTLSCFNIVRHFSLNWSVAL